jgi:hypothetical protein
MISRASEDAAQIQLVNVYTHVLIDVRKAPQLFLAAAGADPPEHQLPLGHSVHAAAFVLVLLL